MPGPGRGKTVNGKTVESRRDGIEPLRMKSWGPYRATICPRKQTTKCLGKIEFAVSSNLCNVIPRVSRSLW